MLTHARLIAATLAILFASTLLRAQSVQSFTLIDANTNAPIPAFDPIPDAATINLFDIGTTQLNIRANTSPATVGSVIFALSGSDTQNQTENVAPYALFGDSSGNFTSWTPPLGAYTLTATAYSGANGSGTAGAPLTITFDIINQMGPPNDPPIVDAGPDQSLPASATSTTLTATASDNDGTIDSVLWSQIAGPAATLTNADTLTLSVSNLQEAFYIFRFSATDDANSTSSDDVAVTVGNPTSTAIVSGELREWHPVTLTWTGPFASETGTPNPFLDYRLNVTFTDGTRTFIVPGFFAVNGNALTTGASQGDKWRVIFSPPSSGDWNYTVSFRSGANIAVDPDPLAGSPVFLDGDSGTLTIAPTDKQRPDFRADGRLLYANDFYLRFEGSGRYYVKGGVDSPENWLGYTGFDNTIDGGAGPNTPDGLHAFPTHAADWNPGDPDWNRNDPPGTQNGRAIIGALNYLHSTGVNSIYFLPMNIGGDGKDSWPYVGPINPNGSTSNDNTRFDVSKLEQWEVFFAHAQSLGIMLHFVLAEAEAANKLELDNATVGTERRLFYREISARFAHHNALVWNVCEEYNLSLNIGSAEALNWAAAISAADPYNHPVTVHNAGNPSNPNSGPWAPFVAQPNIDLTSLQGAAKINGWSDVVEDYRVATLSAGRPLPVMIDEPGSPTRDFNSDFDAFRKSIIWPILLSGGGGEWFINNRDQSLEDFREFDKIWTDTGRIVRFIETYLPFWLMQPDDSLISGANSGFDGPQAFSIPGEIYALYIPAGGTPSLNLGASTDFFEVLWYDPRADRPLLTGSTAFIKGPGVQPIGAAPDTPNEDWAILVRRVPGCPRDLNTDGVIDIEDLYAYFANPTDTDGSGTIDDADADCLIQYIRAAETQDILSPQ